MEKKVRKMSIEELWDILPQTIDVSNYGTGESGTYGAMGFLEAYKEVLDEEEERGLVSVVCYNMPSANSNFISFNGKFKDSLIEMVEWCIENKFLSKLKQ